MRDRLRAISEDYKSVIIPVAGNIACSYNVCNVGYVVQLIRLEHPTPRWAAPAFASSCLFGAVVGQVRWLFLKFPALLHARRSSFHTLLAEITFHSLPPGVVGLTPKVSRLAQLLLGWAGDRFGRRNAMMVSMGLVVSPPPWSQPRGK